MQSPDGDISTGKVCDGRGNAGDSHVAAQQAVLGGGQPCL